jgi:hypothetical protein
LTSQEVSYIYLCCRLRVIVWLKGLDELKNPVNLRLVVIIHTTQNACPSIFFNIYHEVEDLK